MNQDEIDVGKPGKIEYPVVLFLSVMAMYVCCTYFKFL